MVWFPDINKEKRKTYFQKQNYHILHTSMLTVGYCTVHISKISIKGNQRFVKHCYPSEMWSFFSCQPDHFVLDEVFFPRLINIWYNYCSLGGGYVPSIFSKSPEIISAPWFTETICVKSYLSLFLCNVNICRKIFYNTSIFLGEKCQILNTFLTYFLRPFWRSIHC